MEEQETGEWVWIFRKVSFSKLSTELILYYTICEFNYNII